MDRGRMLENASHVLVQVAGGSDMTLSEVEILMQELGRHINDETQILFGTAVDNRMGNRLSVTLISSFASPAGATPIPMKKTAAKIPAVPAPAPKPPIWEQQEEPAEEISQPIEQPVNEVPLPSTELRAEEVTIAEESAAPEALANLEVQEEEARPRLILPKKKPSPIKEPKSASEKSVQARQEVLQFEPVTRGRFEKSEPTIVEGQDLDVPTFLRKNVRVK
jgi:cell division protein FtsZ